MIVESCTPEPDHLLHKINLCGRKGQQMPNVCFSLLKTGTLNGIKLPDHSLLHYYYLTLLGEAIMLGHYER